MWMAAAAVRGVGVVQQRGSVPKVTVVLGGTPSVSPLFLVGKD